jgi:hypothetical protein
MPMLNRIRSAAIRENRGRTHKPLILNKTLRIGAAHTTRLSPDFPPENP